MNDQEILEMYRRNLERVDFSEDEKKKMRIVLRAHMQKMGIETCSYGSASCVDEGTHEYMPGIFICETHHKNGDAIASCAVCIECRAWVVLKGRTKNPEPMMYEFMCPVETCKKDNRIMSGEIRLFALENPVIDRGFFSGQS